MTRTLPLYVTYFYVLTFFLHMMCFARLLHRIAEKEIFVIRMFDFFFLICPFDFLELFQTLDTVYKFLENRK